MALSLLLIWFAGLAHLVLALDPIVASDGCLMNNRTRQQFTMNGILYGYARSNVTTIDVAPRDALGDAEACTRDAALMIRLGINNIVVGPIDPATNHDDCFSIFNSVGIYVTVIMSSNLLFTDPDVEGAYQADHLKDMFLQIDALKDYENLLGIQIAQLPEPLLIGVSNFSRMQTTFRAIVRDVKEYVHHNSPRPLLVGASVPRYLTSIQYWAITPVLQHLSCVIRNEKYPSHVDFVGIIEGNRVDKIPSRKNFTEEFKRLLQEIEDVTVPKWLDNYGTYVLGNKSSVYDSTVETFLQTDMLYNTSNQLIMPYGPLNGGNTWQWANTGNVNVNSGTGGIVRLEKDGTLYLTEKFDTLLGIFNKYNTEAWRSGNLPRPLPDSLECKEDLIENKTMSIGGLSTWTAATDWALPTRLSELDAAITSGMHGTRGQMVDVIVTKIKYEVVDSQGKVIKDVALSPTSSEPRKTTAIQTSESTNSATSAPSRGLSTGVRAGIGVGLGVSGAIALCGAVLFFLRKRKSKRHQTSLSQTAPNGNSSGESTLRNGIQKAELSTGPEVEAQPPAELPDKSVLTPPEVVGDAYPGMDKRPAELPVREPALEVGAVSPRG